MRKYKLFIPDSYRSMKLYELYPLIKLLKSEYWGVEINFEICYTEKRRFGPTIACLPTTWGAINFVSEFIDLDKLFEQDEVCKLIDLKTRKELLEKYYSSELNYEKIINIVKKKLGEEMFYNILSSRPEFISKYYIEQFFAIPLEFIEEIIEKIYCYIQKYLARYSFVKYIKKGYALTLADTASGVFSNFKFLLGSFPEGEIYLSRVPVVENEEILLKNINKCRKPDCVVNKIRKSSLSTSGRDYILTILIYSHGDISCDKSVSDFEDEYTKKLGFFMNYAKPIFITREVKYYSEINLSQMEK